MPKVVHFFSGDAIVFTFMYLCKLVYCNSNCLTRVWFADQYRKSIIWNSGWLCCFESKKNQEYVLLAIIWREVRLLKKPFLHFILVSLCSCSRLTLCFVLLWQACKFLCFSTFISILGPLVTFRLFLHSRPKLLLSAMIAGLNLDFLAFIAGLTFALFIVSRKLYILMCSLLPGQLFACVL